MQKEVEMAVTQAPAEAAEPELKSVMPDSNSVDPTMPIDTKSSTSMEIEIKKGNGVTPATGENIVSTWQNPESFANSSFFTSVMNIINTVIGAGILSIAFSIMKAGVFGSILLILVILIPSILTSYYLSVASVYSNESNYGDIGTKLCGKTVGLCANFSQVLIDFGIDVAYMNVFFSQVMDIIKEVFKIDLDAHKTLISALISLFVLFPMASIKNLDALKYTSMLAVCCVVIFVLACISMGIVGFGQRGWDLESWPRQATDLSSAFAVFVLCFCSHVNTSKFTAELRYNKANSKFKSKAEKATKATVVAYLFCAAAYLFVGICGYLAFGAEIQGSILDSMRSLNVWYKPIVRVGYGVVVISSYPILAFPACCTIDSWMFKGERTDKRRYSEVFVWVLLTYMVYLFIPSLSSIFGVTGNFCGVLLTFVWPSVYFLSIISKENAKPVEYRCPWFKVQPWMEPVTWVLLVLGVIVCIYATGLELMNIMK